MYEQLRERYSTALFGVLPTEEIEKALCVLDIVVDDYELSAKSTALTVCDFEHIPEMLKAYIACKTMENASSETVKNYACILRRFFLSVGKAPAEITTNDIRLYLYKYQIERGCSARTMDKYRMYFCSFFGWALDNGYIPSDPTRKLPRIKYESTQRQAMTQTELEYVRNACKTLREKAIVEFFYSTGCRVSELCVVKKDDISWAERSVHLFGKGKKHRTSYLNAKAEVAIKAYLASRTDDLEYLFVKERGTGKLTKCAVEDIIRKIVEKADVTGKKITPHVFRHTTATTALANGMPVVEISRLLGHSSINTTMIYAQTDDSAVRNSHLHSVV